MIQLKEKRKSLGVTLKKASDDLKINERFLKALEDGDFSVFPAKVYANGFARMYANYLKLDEKSMVLSKETILNSAEQKFIMISQPDKLIPNFNIVITSSILAVLLFIIWSLINWRLIDINIPENSFIRKTEQFNFVNNIEAEIWDKQEIQQNAYHRILSGDIDKSFAQVGTTCDIKIAQSINCISELRNIKNVLLVNTFATSYPLLKYHVLLPYLNKFKWGILLFEETSVLSLGYESEIVREILINEIINF